MEQQIIDLNRQLDTAKGELDGLREQLVNANSQRGMLCTRIDRADDMVSNQLLYCSQVLDVLRGKGEEIKREAQGDVDDNPGRSTALGEA